MNMDSIVNWSCVNIEVNINTVNFFGNFFAHMKIV